MGPDKARDDDRGQHQPAEEAGPGLLETEIEEFREEEFEARAAGDETRRGEDVYEPGEEGGGVGCGVGFQFNPATNY